MYAPMAVIEENDLLLTSDEGLSYEHDDCYPDDTSILQRIFNHSLLTAEEEKKLFLMKGTAQWESAKERLILNNMKLVKSVAMRYRWVEDCEFDDIIQHGAIGLMSAIEKFDPERDLHLSTYAVYWINQEIRTNLVNRRGLIRLPAYLRDEASQIAKIRIELEKEGIYCPSDEMIAQRSGMTPERVRKTMDAVSLNTFSLNTVIGDDNETEIGDLIATDANVEQDAVKRIMLEEVLREMERLTSTERKLICMRYGLYRGKKMSIAECARELNVSNEGCRQIQKRTEEKLRIMCNKKKRQQV